MHLIKDYRFQETSNLSLEEFIRQIDDRCSASGYKKGTHITDPNGCRIELHPKQGLGFYHNSFRPDISIEILSDSGILRVEGTCRINAGISLLLNLFCGGAILLTILLMIVNGPWKPTSYLPLILPAFALLMSWIAFTITRKIIVKDIMPKCG